MNVFGAEKAIVRKSASRIEDEIQFGFRKI
jgi:hypothetical protein